MKKKIAVCSLILIGLGSTAIVRADTAAAAAEKAVTALEAQWTQSQRTNNPALAAPLYAEKYIGIGTDGTISTREDDLADAKATKFTSVDIKDFHVTVFGHTVIATMVFMAKGTDAKGKPLDINARWADTWTETPGGGWQCVLSQGSDLKF